MSDMAWVAVGDQANWEKGLESGIWGIVPECTISRLRGAAPVR
jgi:hypothetical protein